MKSRVTGGVRWPLPLLALLVALAGCGGGGGSTAPPVSSAGLSVRKVEDPAFSIAVPKSWLSVDQRSARRTRTSNPRLRAAIRTLTRPATPVRFIAVAPAQGKTFAANMNVIETRVPSSVSFDDLVKNEANQIKLVSALHDLQQETVELPAGRALRLTYRVRRRGYVSQYFVKHENELYVLTYTAALADGPHYAPIFDRSAHTFRLG
jgi:hypothetical protein